MTISQSGRSRAILCAVFATAIGVRVIHLLQIRRAPFFTILMGDSREYDEWAQRIAAGDWLGHDVFYQAPLYPYLLGLVYALGGRHLLLVRVIQAIIGSLSCVLLADAGRRIFSNGVGYAAGFGLALYAPAIFFDGLIQKSVLDVFFISLMLWLIARTQDEGAAPGSTTPARWTWLGLGAALGGLSLTRENALALLVILGIWSALRSPKRFALLAAGLAIVLVPVAARNSYLGGGFYLTTSQFGPNFYIGNNPGADGTYQPLRYGRGAPEYERQDATDLAEGALKRKLRPSEVSGYWADRGFAFITARPGAWLKLIARKAALLLNDAEVVDTEDQGTHAEWSWPLGLLGPVARFGVLVPLAVLGVPVSWPRRARWWIVITLASGYAASVVLFYVVARYRYPLVPFLVLFAAAGAVNGWVIFRGGSRPTWSALAAAAAVAGAAVLANWPLVSVDQMRAVTENNLGAALQTEGRYDEADAHYRRAIALRPGYPPAYNNLGSALRAQGRLDAAIATYRRALNLQPDFPDADYNLANVLLDRGSGGDVDEAIDRLESSLRAIPRSADAHNNLGIALASKGRAEAAAREFQAALDLDPDSATAHRNLGDLLASTGDRGAAIAHLRRAVQNDARNGDAHYDLGSVLLEAGALDEAIREFRLAVERLPRSAEARNNLGIALGSQGKLGEAVEQFRAALAIRPEFQEAKRNLAMALARERALDAKRQ